MSLENAYHDGLSQLLLLLEEVCCDLCRLHHVEKDGLKAEAVQIDREFPLGGADNFADIRVLPAGQRPYFVEVKHGYSDATLLRHMSRKYGTATDAIRGSAKVILVIDLEKRPDWPQVKAALSQALHRDLALEVWDEQLLIGWLKERIGVEIRAINQANLLDVRQAIDRSKGFYAFGGPSLAEYDHDPLKSELLWHFGFWQLRQVRAVRGLAAGEIFPPGYYRGVAVLLADLCGFSSYVRDTADGEIIRESLTAFYSKARYQVINSGGMLLQFVGDQVVAVFGVLDSGGDCARDALRTARALVHIGGAVSHHWQRRIDRLQPAAGLHIGMALGDLQIVSLRPFSRTRMGAIGDCINVAARLMALAGPSEIVVSNSLYQRIEDSSQRSFVEVAPVEAKNVGRIKAWKESMRLDASELSAG